MKSKVIKVTLVVFIIIVSIAITAFNDDNYFKINKNFEIFGAVFKELSSNYVNDISPDILLQNGIEGMLKNLDPYTVFIESNETDEIEVITTGKYTGFGLSISQIDNANVITGLQTGFPAQKAGLRIGDKIFKLDTTVVLYLGNDLLKNFTKGTPGALVDFKIIRDGIKDTLDFKIKRDLISLKSVTYSEIINDSIAYIKLERFSNESAQEVKNSLVSLTKHRKISGIILDLRDNPGGLLDAAVRICELFLPQGTLIVSTKGKNGNRNYNYFSQNLPIFPNTPLTVLINEGSASASEIVAGALQDMDRAIVLGNRSFGKGLVQTIVELPYKNELKLTTSKYYTPSGRCIQRLNYEENDKNKIVEYKKTNNFLTKNGRKVLESKGITPDSIIIEEKISEFSKELVFSNAIFSFANHYSGKLQNIQNNFKVDKAILNDFSNYVSNKKYNYQSSEMKKLSEIKLLAQNRKYTEETLLELDALEVSLNKERKIQLDLNKNEISELLKKEILKRFYSYEDMLKYEVSKDKLILISSEFLLNQQYKKILANQKNKDGNN
jgi:carboxyl-terminal processing protease